MQFIFSTGSLYTYGIDRCFELAVAAGFEGIELLVDSRWDTRQPAYIQRLIDHFQLPVLAVHAPFAPWVPGWPSDEPDRIRETTRLAEALDAKVVVHHLPLRFGLGVAQLGPARWMFPILGWDMHKSYRRWLEREYAAFQAGTTVKLCIENMPSRRWLGWAWQIYTWNNGAWMERFSSLTLDTTHMGTWGTEPAAIYPKIRHKVQHVHLSNFNGQEHRRPEDGWLRLDRLLALLAADNYQGAVCIELDPSALEAGGPDAHNIQLLTASLSKCREWACPPTNASVGGIACRLSSGG